MRTGAGNCEIHVALPAKPPLSRTDTLSNLSFLRLPTNDLGLIHDLRDLLHSFARPKPPDLDRNIIPTYIDCYDILSPWFGNVINRRTIARAERLRLIVPQHRSQPQRRRLQTGGTVVT